MNRRMIASLVFCGILATGITARAQGGEEIDPNTGALGFSGGLDITTHYFFRGLNTEDQGFIVQPWAEVGINIYEGDSDINSIGAILGIWNSFQDEHTGADPDDGGTESWFESDLIVGLVFGVGDRTEVGVTYVAYTSPNGAFDTIEEIDLSISFDDAQCWEDAGIEAPGFSGLQPSLTFGFEVDGSVFGPDEGTYLELAITPRFILIDDGSSPVFLKIPITVGFSISDYYDNGVDDDGFGYVDIGFFLSKALDSVPSEYGQWSVDAGFDVLFLGDNLEAVNNDDDVEIVGSLKVGLEY